MAVKFKGPLFNKREREEQLAKSLKSITQDELKLIIVNGSILKGISPVEGDGKFQKYSESYKKAIDDGKYKEYGKAKLPVNLKLSGEMLDTFFSKQIKDGIQIGFKHKLADIHSKQGAGKSKVIRRMLPVVKGSVFKRSITKDIIDLVQKKINRILGK